jgi:WD40 repeat protein
VACLYIENRVVIHDTETNKQKEIGLNRPWRCAASRHHIAVATDEDGLHLFTRDGDLILIIPDSNQASCVAFHPLQRDFLGVGFQDGSVRIWTVLGQQYVFAVKNHADYIHSIRFAEDGRLFLSSCDFVATILTLNSNFQEISKVKLTGHTRSVRNVLPLPSSDQCLTCSDDTTVKVWDCQTGTCLRTLTQHSESVFALALHSNRQIFASGSSDRFVFIMSSATLDVLRCIQLSDWAQALVFGEHDALYAGVRSRGVVSCNTLTCETGPVVIPCKGHVVGLALGMY